MFKNLNLNALGVSGRTSEIIELTLSTGFKGLDLDIVDFAAQVQAAGLPHARRLIDSARLKMGSFELPLGLDSAQPEFEQALVKLREYAALAQQMGCTRATTAIEPASDDRPYHENFELYRRRLSELAALLAEYDIRLGISFRAPEVLRRDRAFQFIQTTEPFLLLLKTISDKRIGLALDTWHWHLGGGTLDQIHSLDGDRIVTVSLADAAVGTTAENADEANRRLPGETGVIDSAAVLAALQELKYDGPVTPMPSPSIFAGQGRDKIVKAAATAFDAVWNAAGIRQRPQVPGRNPGQKFSAASSNRSG